ncbi:MAG: DUF2304 domain-containing protein [Acidobacteriia bacterium]|nr:DUF2304 domain-containing protein [Terriglobia bacterium]
MDKLLNVTAALSIVLIVAVLFSLRRAHIRVEYSVSWLAAGLAVFVLTRWESALIFLAQASGITYPPAALLAITMAVFLIVLYRMSMIISTLKDNNIALAQKVAILEFRMQSRPENSEAEARP